MEFFRMGGYRVIGIAAGCALFDIFATVAAFGYYSDWGGGTYICGAVSMVIAFCLALPLATVLPRTAWSYLIVILIGMSPVPAVIGYNIYEDWSAREAAPSDLFRYNLNPDEPIPGSVASLQVFTSHDEDGGIGLISFEISLKDLEHLLAQDKFKLLSAQTRPFKVGQAYTQLLGADYQIYTKSEGEGVIDELLVAKSRKKCVLRQIDNR